MFKINYGYGTSKKQYKTLKGAKIACRAFFKKSNVNWLDVVEIRTVTVCHSGQRYLTTEVIHHTIER